MCLVFDCRYSGIECRRRAAVEVLWPMDRAVDGGEGQPGPELGPGGSCGVHSWIEGASADGMVGFLVCAIKPSWRTTVEDAKSWRNGRRSRDWRRNGCRRHLGPCCGRGGDGRRAASRAVRRPRRERRPEPRRGGWNLSARGVLAVFSKPATYPSFVDPPKPRTGSSSPRRHRGEDFDSKKQPWPLDESLYLFPVLPLRAF